MRVVNMIILSAILLWFLPLAAFLLLGAFPEQALLDAWLTDYSIHFKEQREASFSALLVIPGVLIGVYGAMLALPAHKLPSVTSLGGSRMMIEIQDNYQRVKQREAVIVAAWFVSLALVSYHVVGVFGSAAFIRHYGWFVPEGFMQKIRKFAYVSWIHPNYLLAQVVLFIIIVITMVEVAVPLVDQLGGELKRLERLRALWGVMVQFRKKPPRYGRWVSCSILIVNLTMAVGLIWMNSSRRTFGSIVIVWVVMLALYVFSFSERSQSDIDIKILRWTFAVLFLLPSIIMIEYLYNIFRQVSIVYFASASLLIVLFIATAVMLGVVRPYIPNWDFEWERSILFNMALRSYVSEREGLARYMFRADDALILTLLTAQAELEKKQPHFLSDHKLLRSPLVPKKDSRELRGNGWTHIELPTDSLGDGTKLLTARQSAHAPRPSTP